MSVEQGWFAERDAVRKAIILGFVFAGLVLTACAVAQLAMASTTNAIKENMVKRLRDIASSDIHNLNR